MTHKIHWLTVVVIIVVVVIASVVVVVVYSILAVQCLCLLHDWCCSFIGPSSSAHLDQP